MVINIIKDLVLAVVAFAATAFAIKSTKESKAKEVEYEKTVEVSKKLIDNARSGDVRSRMSRWTRD